MTAFPVAGIRNVVGVQISAFRLQAPAEPFGDLYCEPTAVGQISSALKGEGMTGIPGAGDEEAQLHGLREWLTKPSTTTES